MGMVQVNTVCLLVASPQSQGSAIEKYQTNNITGRKERKQNKKEYTVIYIPLQSGQVLV